MKPDCSPTVIATGLSSHVCLILQMGQTEATVCGERISWFAGA